MILKQVVTKIEWMDQLQLDDLELDDDERYHWKLESELYTIGN